MTSIRRFPEARKCNRILTVEASHARSAPFCGWRCWAAPRGGPADSLLPARVRPSRCGIAAGRPPPGLARGCGAVWRGLRASNRFDSLARSIRSNLPQCLTTGAMRRIDLACRLTETVAELVSSRFAFKATGPAPQLQLLFWLSHCHARSSDGPFAGLYYSASFVSHRSV